MGKRKKVESSDMSQFPIDGAKASIRDVFVSHNGTTQGGPWIFCEARIFKGGFISAVRSIVNVFLTRWVQAYSRRRYSKTAHRSSQLTNRFLRLC